MDVRKISKRKRKKVKTIFGALSFTSFFLMLGTVGAVETNALPLGQGMTRSWLLLALFVLFAYLGGAFENEHK